jgi:hypothetical protein
MIIRDQNSHAPAVAIHVRDLHFTWQAMRCYLAIQSRYTLASGTAAPLP